MKLRLAILILLATILSACNFTLAADVTPPPGYIPPTPMPTLVLVPPHMPDVSNGEAIYFEKCAGCHGENGMGDGPAGIQLGVTVPAFALPEIARPASPAAWYTTVTRGKMDRFMPPFASLNDQQRWDVVAYLMTLHTSDEQIQKGKEIFEANCPGCSTDFFRNLDNMSALSSVELARIVRLGNDQIAAFGENLSDEDMWAVADYLRSLSYTATPPATPTPVLPTATPVSTEAGAPAAEGTPVGTGQAEAPLEAATVISAGFGSVIGAVENRTGRDLPSDLLVTLRGYEHDFANPNAGTQEVLTLDGKLTAGSTFSFDNVEMPENRIFLAEVTYKGIGITSEFVVTEAGQASIELPPIVLYEITSETTGLVVDELDMFISMTGDGKFEIVALYTFRNQGETIIEVKMGDTQEIPFIQFPEGAEGLGYEAMQDSARFISTTDGFAMAPDEQPYGILAYSSVTREKETSISQSLALPAATVRIFVPDGMQAKGDQFTDDGVQDVQGTSYQSYVTGGLKAGDRLTFTISGTPKESAAAGEAASGSKNTLLIGAGGLGLVLILAGVWMFLRERKRVEEQADEEEDEFDSSEDVMDAILALDDLYRAKKISDETYQKRRSELKELLKEMM